MPFYRKKPVVIEARPLPHWEDGDITTFVDTVIDIANWCGGTSYMMCNADEPYYDGCEVLGPHMIIPTLEGDMVAREGDFIIKGVQGEFYPCKPDIFEQTYEEVLDADRA